MTIRTLSAEDRLDDGAVRVEVGAMILPQLREHVVRTVGLDIDREDSNHFRCVFSWPPWSGHARAAL